MASVFIVLDIYIAYVWISVLPSGKFTILLLMIVFHKHALLSVRILNYILLLADHFLLVDRLSDHSFWAVCP